ncbi:MAG: helix-hairpin-helix domain-containing protein [candidate division NC10 bacterium]|nr:helix-hairpin-helix domain-containing protein [candidate division NC10 bacterium]
MPRYSSREALLILLLAALLGLAIWVSHGLRARIAASEPTAPWLWTTGSETIQDSQSQRPRSLEQDRLDLGIDPNQAREEELERLPGIGPVLAARIIRYRQRFGPFRDVEELKKVDGIGEKRFERVKPWITLKDGKR